MNHLTQKIKDLFKQWLELELENTCTSLDTYNSISIQHLDDVVIATKMSRGTPTYLATYSVVSEEIKFSDYLPTPLVSLLIYGLEKSIEKY